MIVQVALMGYALLLFVLASAPAFKRSAEGRECQREQREALGESIRAAVAALCVVAFIVTESDQDVEIWFVLTPAIVWAAVGEVRSFFAEVAHYRRGAGEEVGSPFAIVFAHLLFFPAFCMGGVVLWEVVRSWGSGVS